MITLAPLGNTPFWFLPPTSVGPQASGLSARKLAGMLSGLEPDYLMMTGQMQWCV